MKQKADMLKRKILDGAVLLFLEKGIENVTTRELTEHVGISRSHIYHYFRDWQSLSLEALTLFIHTELQQVATSMDGQPAQDKLSTLVRHYLPEGPDAVWQLYAALWQLAARNPAYATLAGEVIAQWQQLLTDIIDEGVASGVFGGAQRERTIRQLGALLNGYSDMLIVAPSGEVHRQAMGDIDAFIRHSLRVGQG